MELTNLMDGFIELAAGTAVCFARTYKNQGIRGLYAGTAPALIANIAENAVLFTAYGYCQKAVCTIVQRQSTAKMTSLEHAIAGSMAAFFVAFVLCPTELLKCRLQAQSELTGNHQQRSAITHCTPWSISKQMYKSEGIRSFFVGLIPTLAREIPGYFCFFGAYETCRLLFTPPGKTKDEIGLVNTALSGAAAGCSLWTAIFPVDVVKSRMQIGGEKGRFSEIFMKILREEGVKAFYKGLSPTLIQTCISSACLFVAYENTKKFLRLF